MSKEPSELDAALERHKANARDSVAEIAITASAQSPALFPATSNPKASTNPF